MSLTVRPITAEQHLAHIAARAQGTGLVSALQVPGWAAVKSDWRNESLGWFDGESLVGAGLVLYRQVPRLPRYLAYLPEGPDIDWLGEGPAARTVRIDLQPFTLVGATQALVGDRTLPHVEDAASCKTFRIVDHHRAGPFQIPEADQIRRAVVWCKHSHLVA